MKNKLFIALLLLVSLPTSVFALGDGTYQLDNTSAYELNLQVIQEVTAEMSLALEDTNLTLTSAIAGLTGGTATGNSDISVLTNNATGYTVNIKVSNDAVMQGPGSSVIPALSSDGPWPSVAGTAAFGYATSAADYWLVGSATGRNDIITTSSTGAAGATTTIYFKVQIGANPSPMIDEGFYYATTTFTATMNP